MIKKLVILFSLISCVIGSEAIAGSSCKPKPMSNQELQKIGEYSVSLYNMLQNLDQKVVMIARVGSDLSKYNIKYTHFGYVVKDYPAGKWTVVHLLNDCGTNYSKIYDQGLMNFYLDDLFKYDTLVVVPSDKVQRALYASLTGHKKHAIHNKGYSMIANPFSDKYQNSNQWVLEILASSINSLLTTRAQIQQSLQSDGYQPNHISIDPLAKLGASLFKANIAFDDHSADASSSGNYPVVTVDSIVNFMKQHNLVKEILELN
jgi:hypothetical protein